MPAARVLKSEREYLVSVAVYFAASYAIVLQQEDKSTWSWSSASLSVYFRPFTSPLQLVPLSRVRFVLLVPFLFTSCIFFRVYIALGVSEQDGCADTPCFFGHLSPLFIG